MFDKWPSYSNIFESMPTVNEDMLVDAVDHSDSPIGAVRRGEVFRLRVNFRVAHDLLFNSRGEMLIQQLAATRPRHPGYWGSSVAAYLFAGESYAHAAERRLREELGVQGVELVDRGRFSMLDQGCEKFIAVFTTTYDGPLNVDEHHINRVEFVSPAVIHEMIASGTRYFTPTFLRVIDFLRVSSSRLM
jgi:isopentenyl-diphosphate delta-isomerase